MINIKRQVSEAGEPDARLSPKHRPSGGAEALLWDSKLPGRRRKEENNYFLKLHRIHGVKRVTKANKKPKLLIKEKIKIINRKRMSLGQVISDQAGDLKAVIRAWIYKADFQ